MGFFSFYAEAFSWDGVFTDWLGWVGRYTHI